MSVESITETTQYLTFKLEDELYALDIVSVQSVLDFEKVTKVPRTPGFMNGVINLRGSVVPIVDIKYKFGMGKTEKTVDSCIDFYLGKVFLVTMRFWDFVKGKKFY